MNQNDPYANAIALSTAVGLRPFAILAISAVLVHFHILHPSHTFAWMGSDGVAGIFIFLALAEVIADKIPLVDHVLQLSHLPIAPIAAALVAGTAIPNAGSSHLAWAAMAFAAINALGVRTTSSGVRYASSAVTLGIANPVISIIEDLVAIALVVVAFVLPFVAIAIGLLCLFAAVRVVRAGGGVLGRFVHRRAAVPAR